MKFDFNSRTPEETERHIRKPLSPSFSRTFLPHGLQAQEAPRKQANLFEIAPPPACEHRETQPQVRFDGGTDQLCTTCGKVVFNQSK